MLATKGFESVQPAAWTRRQIVALVAIATLAFLVRIYYVHSAVIVDPIRGDAVQYMIYAINLLDHHVFSMQTGATPLADGFRDPGYPAFLAALMKVAGRQQGFYLLTLNVQSVISAATVAMYFVLARRWLGITAAVVVGLGMTFWPHAITLTGYVLSETLVAFLFALALILLQVACDRRSHRIGAASGLVFAAAAMTNATLLPVLPLFALIALWRDRDRRTIWSMVLLAALIPSTVWSVRGVSLAPGASDGAGDRIAMNFVQGSWPEYHSAWSSTFIKREEAPKAVLNAIDADYNRLKENRAQGLARILNRLSSEPLRYALWYLSKPIELWGWEIGIGNGGIYVFPTLQSPLSGHGPLRVTTDLLIITNPLLMSFALFGLLAVAATARTRPVTLVLGAFSVSLLTAVFTVLQADARYAAPYRGLEWVLAAAGWMWLVACYESLRVRLRSRQTSVTAK
jgi:4-amino-4-deoxy-L-arabinose transferase-like glycosyltransferase